MRTGEGQRRGRGKERDSAQGSGYLCVHIALHSLCTYVRTHLSSHQLSHFYFCSLISISVSHSHFVQEEQITVEVRIDRRVHSRLIGQRGKAIAKVMEQYKVDIKFPRDKSSDVVTIMGLEENVVDAREDLLSKTDDFVSASIPPVQPCWSYWSSLLAPPACRRVCG